jgi:peptide deformylase
MVVTVKTERALGLAAVQVGVPVRVMVLQNKEGTTTLINPITRDTQGKVYVEEGCLSLPHLYVKVPRAESVRVDYYDENAALQQKWFHSFESRAYQHEMDHLNGLVMLDRLSDYRRKEAEQKWAKLANKLAKG